MILKGNKMADPGAEKKQEQYGFKCYLHFPFSGQLRPCEAFQDTSSATWHVSMQNLAWAE